MTLRNADFFVMLSTEGDVVVDVEKSVRLPFLVEPDERTLDLEEHLHRLFALIDDQRMALARRLVDEIAGGGCPVVLKVAPLASDRIGEHLVGMVVPVHQPRLLRHQDVAPFVLSRRDPQRPRGNGFGERHIVTLVLGGRVLDIDFRQRIGLEDFGNRRKILPEFGRREFRRGFLPRKYLTLMPPSTIIIAPVTKLDWSDAR